MAMVLISGSPNDPSNYVHCASSISFIGDVEIYNDMAYYIIILQLISRRRRDSGRKSFIPGSTRTGKNGPPIWRNGQTRLKNIKPIKISKSLVPLIKIVGQSF